MAETVTDVQSHDLVGSNHHALEHRDRIRRAARAARHLERQPHEHELVAVLFSTRFGERLEQGVVEERNAVVEKHAVYGEG